MSPIKLVLLSLLILAILVCIAGCGGGGNQVTNVFNQQTRQLRPGDKWIYDCTDTSISGQPMILYRSTYTETITPDTVTTPTGITASVLCVTLDTGIDDTIPQANTSKCFLRQAGNGSIYMLGYENSIGQRTWVTEPFQGEPILPELVVGINQTKEVTTDDGESRTVIEMVDGCETVTVPAGTFSAVKITSTTTIDGSDILRQIWWVPQIGRPVKVINTFSSNGVSTNTVTMQLRSTELTLN